MKKILEDRLSIDVSDKNKNEEELIQDMRDRFAHCTAFFSSIHELMREDFDFYKGFQWSDAELERRRNAGRPADCINIINQFVDKVVSYTRQNPPSIDVKSSDFKINKTTVAVYSAYVKKIEKDSYASRAYIRAMHNTAVCGLGGFKLAYKYRDENSFKKKMEIEAFTSPFSFYFDPNFGDNLNNMEYAFTFDFITMEEFENRYPKFFENGKLKYQYDLKKPDDMWFDGEYVRIAEYYYKKRTKKTLYLLENNVSIFKDIYEKNKMTDKIIKQRMVEDVTIKCMLTNGVEILEETTLPFKSIPIIPTFGNYLNVDGEISFEGVVRQLKPIQRFYNYTANKEIEMISSMSVGKFMVAEGTIENHRKDWDELNTSNKPYFEYKTTDSSGTPASPPTPINQIYSSDVSANMLLRAKEDAKSQTGIHSTSLGEPNTGEVSGVAVSLKQEQSQVLGYKFIDSLSDSLEYLGKMIIEGMPYVIDEETTIKIKDNDTQEDREINIVSDPDVDLSYSEISVETNISLHNETRRQQAVRNLFGLMQLNPEKMVPLLSPKYVELQDFQGSDEVAKLMKKTYGIDDDNSQLQQKIIEIQQQYEAQMEQIKQEAQNQIMMKDKALMDQQLLVSNMEAEFNIEKNKKDINDMKNSMLQSSKTVENAIKMIDVLIKSGYAINSKEVSKFIEIAYGFTTYSEELMNQSNNVQLSDEVIIPGINDVITRSQEEINEEEAYKSDLMKLEEMVDSLGLGQNINPTDGLPRTTIGSY